MLLLVENIMFRASHDPLVLHSRHGLSHRDARQVRIRSKPFPVTAPGREEPQRSNRGTKSNINALPVELCAKCTPSLANEVSGERRRRVYTGGESGGFVGCFVSSLALQKGSMGMETGYFSPNRTPKGPS